MKTLILFLIPFWGFTQIQVQEKTKSITVGEATRGGLFLCRVNYYPGRTDTMIAISFKNDAYTAIIDIKSILFDGGKSEINFLKKSMLSVAEGEKGSELNLKLIIL